MEFACPIYRVKSIAEAEERYGKIEDGEWKDAGKWCVVITPPAKLSWLNSASGKPVQKIYVNRDMAGALLNALNLVVDRDLEDELETFDGCFMVRDVRGAAGQLSCHAYALAIDINAKSNPLGQAPQMSPELVKCFTDRGFVWGGNFHRKDGMHFSLGWEHPA